MLRIVYFGCQDLRRRAVVLAGCVLIISAGAASGQLPYLESFESDGDGSRYTLTDPGFVADTGEAGPAIWGRVAYVPDTPAPLSIEGVGGSIGLASAAPDKRAAILWSSTLTEDDVDFEAWSVWLSLMNWMTDGKDSATVGFFPPHDPNTLVPTLVQSLGYSIVDIEDSTMLPAADSLDLVIQTDAGVPVPPIAFIDYEVPLIAFNAGNHDDTAITGIGETVDFEGAATISVTNPDHPILSNPDFPVEADTLRWTNVPSTLAGVGKPHSGGTVLATVENPLTGNDDPALFVIEKGGGLLGTFDPQPDGDLYLAGAALNKFGASSERSLELFPVSINGEENVKVAVALAATDADFEPGDYLNVLIDTSGTGDNFELVAEYRGVTEPASVRGALVDTISGHILLSNEFQDRIFDVPDGSSSVLVRFDTLNTWGNEIVGIDNIRVYSQPDVTCDFNGDGTCDVADLDALLYGGQQNQDTTYDLTGDGTVDLADRDAWLTEAGTATNGQAYPPGDFNFSNKTDAGDLNILGIAWQSDATSYADGDANGDGVVNAGDLNIVGIHWQEEGAVGALASAVPEPGLGWLPLLGCLLWGRSFRRRR